MFSRSNLRDGKAVLCFATGHRQKTGGSAMSVWSTHAHAYLLFDTEVGGLSLQT